MKASRDRGARPFFGGELRKRSGLAGVDGLSRIPFWRDVPNLTITRDQAGLGSARELSQSLVAVVAVLESAPALPAKVSAPVALKMMPNPFT